MSGRMRLPALVRWLLVLATHPSERAYLLDDLSEEFDDRVRSHGRGRALRWAVSQALRSLGPLAVSRLRARLAAHRHAPRGDPMLIELRDDLRYSLRVAVRRPWLSLTIIATIILGVGTTTAVFSIIDALLLRPLSFSSPEQLVRLSSPLKDAPFAAMVVNHADISDLQHEMRSLTSIGLYDVSGAITQTGPDPERVSVVQAGQGFGETLKLRPVLGRLFSPDEY